MSNGIEIKNLPSATTIKQNDTMTIVQDRENKQLPLDRFANESDLKTLSVLENRCDEVKAKIEVDEYSAEITTSQSMSEIGSDDNGANLHENVLDGAFESCVLKGKTKYRDIDTGEILEDFEEGRNLELITVRMPILSTTGKNLWNPKKMFVYENLSDELYSKQTLDFLQIGKNYVIKAIKTDKCQDRKVWINYNGENINGYNLIDKGLPTNHLPNGFIYTGVEMLGIYTEGISKEDMCSILHDEYNFFIYESGTHEDVYEPHKSSILSLPEEVVLRSLPDGTCDTLNVETSEYVQRIGERSYQNGDTNSNNLVTDGTKTQYKLSSPIITKVDVQGFPHAYANGHIQLTSGSIEPSLTPTVTYKVPVSRMGQIASNTKSNLRQSIKLDQLEVLVYQSLINTEYENLLVQNSAESATSFRNLSVNDPKDGLYYMLKHLIEENQPVQNMLDKINLFYLYGLLSDEHYFDLLLGGEVDVY